MFWEFLKFYLANNFLISYVIKFWRWKSYLLYINILENRFLCLKDSYLHSFENLDSHFHIALHLKSRYIFQIHVPMAPCSFKSKLICNLRKFPYYILSENKSLFFSQTDTILARRGRNDGESRWEMGGRQKVGS